MKIGLCYDLRADYLAAGYGEEETAEFDKPETIEAIEQALRGRGAETERIGNLFALVGRLDRGERWDMVFNIAEGLYGYGREAAIPALLDAWRIPYTFGDPLCLTLTLHKGMAKHVVARQGLPTPAFFVAEQADELERCRLPFPCFVKPVAEGTGKGIAAASRIEGPEALRQVGGELLRRFHQPVLVEEYLPGREFTVGVLGSGKTARAMGAMEVLLPDRADPGVYSYHNKEHYQGLVSYRLADDDTARRACDIALAAYQVLGCRDGGRVDLRCDAAGIPHFIEVNPLAGLHPVHSDLCILAHMVGMSHEQLIGAIVDSALARRQETGVRGQGADGILPVTCHLSPVT